MEFLKTNFEVIVYFMLGIIITMLGVIIDKMNESSGDKRHDYFGED